MGKKNWPDLFLCISSWWVAVLYLNEKLGFQMQFFLDSEICMQSFKYKGWAIPVAGMQKVSDNAIIGGGA